MDSDYRSLRVQVAVFSSNHPEMKSEVPGFGYYTEPIFLTLLLFCSNKCYHNSTQFLFSLLYFFFSPPKTIAEFDLGAVNYEVKSPKCHELSLAAPPHDRISFNFRCEQEAQEWATVLMSSLREAHRGQSTFQPNSLSKK